MTSVLATGPTMAMPPPVVPPSVVMPAVSGAGGAPDVPAAGGAASVPSAPERTTTGPSYAATVASIFDAKCTMSCHEPVTGLLGGPDGVDLKVKMDLTPGAAYAALTSGTAAQLPSMWIVGETLADSYLWYKLNNTQLSVDGEGGTMPLTGDPLTAAELLIVQAWIEGGASP